MKRIEISAAAIIDALTTLDLHAAGLERLAESLEQECVEGRHIDLLATRGHIKQIRDHASALEGLREDLALSAPDDLEGSR